jgi:hypothetical protein
MVLVPGLEHLGDGSRDQYLVVAKHDLQLRLFENSSPGGRPEISSTFSDYLCMGFLPSFEGITELIDQNLRKKYIEVMR